MEMPTRIRKTSLRTQEGRKNNNIVRTIHQIQERPKIYFAHTWAGERGARIRKRQAPARYFRHPVLGSGSSALHGVDAIAW